MVFERIQAYLTWILKHIVVDDEVHAFLVCNEKQIYHAVSINISKIKHLVILNQGDIIDLDKAETIETIHGVWSIIR